MIKCEYCKKEFPKNSKKIAKGSAVFHYLCSDCQKINPCGNPFCPPGRFHEH